MAVHPAPSDFEARTNATYEALMWALSRPGKLRRLPGAGQAALIETLVDRECRVYAQDDALRQLAGRAGAHLVPPDAADHLFLAAPPAPDLLRDIPQGSDLYPENGATLVFPASFGSGAGLRLTGPGIDGALDTQIAGIPGGFWAERQLVMRYPMGFEIFLLDGDQVMGLPRSTEIEVL